MRLFCAIAFLCSVLLCLLAPGSRAQTLQATVTVDNSGQTVWSYTLTNNEPAGSSNWLTYFYLNLSAPVSNAQASNGWTPDTDGTTYVQWFNGGGSPYSDDIAPGNSVSGFQFTTAATGSTAVDYEIGSWDHGNQTNGPVVDGTVLVPYAAPAPEPSPVATLALGALGLGLLVLRYRHRALGGDIPTGTTRGGRG